MARHWFVAGREELIAQGFTVPRIDNWVKSGRLVELFRGVYSFGRDLDTWQGAMRSALLAAGPGAVLTGRSACEILGLVDRFAQVPGYIEVAVPAGRPRLVRGRSPALRKTWVRVVRRQLAPNEVRTVEGLRVVTAPMALIDFAVKTPERDVFFAFLEACRLGLLGREEVDYCFRRVSYRRGAKKIKPLLAQWVPGLNQIKSVFEGEYLLAWLAKGLPPPEVNVKVFGREVDEYWKVAAFALELDGGAFHSDPVARARDEEKTRYLRANGLRVRRVTREEFHADPDGVIDSVARQAGFI